MNKPPKILLIGWDAADWKIINPLLDAGLMPNLQRLIDNGVVGNLATLDPAFSPMLWTSIATGKRPYKHGVLGFTEPHPNGKDVRPVQSTSRTTKALWNVFKQCGLKSHVVGWWPSHPAEPINGISIDRFLPKVYPKSRCAVVWSDQKRGLSCRPSQKVFGLIDYAARQFDHCRHRVLRT
jgi:predicted AlkP superfamily phosphohydrolase/phosphomutase